MGEYQYRDVVIPDGIPAIISQELFSMAQQRLEKNRYAPSSYKSHEKYLLTTKLICGDCGSFMVGECGKSGTNGKKYYYYKCSTAKKKNGCSRKALRKNDIEQLVIDKTVKSIFTGDVIEQIAYRVEAWQEKENTAIPILQSQLAETEKCIDNFMEAIAQGIITASTKKRLSELEFQKIDIEAKIAREEIGSQVLTREQILYWLNKMRELNLMNEDSRECVIDTFINSIYVYYDKVVINFNCREDSETIPLAFMDSSSFLSEVGEPITHNPNTFVTKDVFGFIVLIPSNLTHYYNAHPHDKIKEKA